MSDPRRVVDVRVTLPEDWWVIPLSDEAKTREAVRGLLRRQFSGIEDRPLFQSQLRAELLGQAAQAAQSGGRLLAISLTEVAGVPVPASMVLSWIDPPVGDRHDPGDVLMNLRDALYPDPAARLPAGHSLDLARLPPGSTLRHLHLPLTLSQAGPDSAPGVPSFVADYWLERPDGAGLVQFAFGSPMVAIQASMVELFDAIVSAIRWVDADSNTRSREGVG